MLTFNKLGYYGRLGNAMFQFATLLNVAKVNGYTFGIPYNNEIPRNTISDHTGTYNYGLDIHKCFELNIPDSSGHKAEYRFRPNGFEYDPSILNIKDNTDIEGYFQSEKYFKENKDFVLNTFRFKKEFILAAEKKMVNYRKGNNKKIIFVHIRRGDYVNLQNSHPLLSFYDYYIPAMEKFDKKNTIFVIFSDDIEWCKTKFINNGNIYYSETNNPFVDLSLMAMCDGAIIANSSYSWWGAYMIRKMDKVIVAPKVWFGPRYDNLDTKDLIPDEWIKI